LNCKVAAVATCYSKHEMVISEEDEFVTVVVIIIMIIIVTLESKSFPPDVN
jgi:hypothetical protein